MSLMKVTPALQELVYLFTNVSLRDTVVNEIRRQSMRVWRFLNIVSVWLWYQKAFGGLSQSHLIPGVGFIRARSTYYNHLLMIFLRTMKAVKPRGFSCRVRQEVPKKNWYELAAASVGGVLRRSCECCDILLLGRESLGLSSILYRSLQLLTSPSSS